MKKNAEGISVNTGRATFLLQNKWFYIHNVRSSRPEFSVIQPFRTFRKLLLLLYYYYYYYYYYYHYYYIIIIIVNIYSGTIYKYNGFSP